jgi:hypothetical protein
MMTMMMMMMMMMRRRRRRRRKYMNLKNELPLVVVVSLRAKGNMK